MVNFLRGLVKYRNLRSLDTPAAASHSIYSQNATIKKSISENALKVVYRLNKAGYAAYLVGGGVRDLLLDRAPKDFDIATDATPEEIKELFRNCRLIGRRFRLAHILFHQEIIEVATFRGELDEEMLSSNNKSYRTRNGMVLRDNIYGSIEQDAQRRDFSINSLYYDINNSTVRDYTNGMQDLAAGVIRLIGDPMIRYREDPVRMLRAIRFSAKLGFKIEKFTAAPIKQLAPLLTSVPAARLFDENIKLLQSGYGSNAYQLLKEYALFDVLFPSVIQQYATYHASLTDKIITQVLKNTDERIANNHHINPAFLLATILWYPLLEKTDELLIDSGLHYNDAFSIAAHNLIQSQNKITMLPKRISMVMHDIWFLQLKLAKSNTPQKAARTLAHPKFKAGYDLFALRTNLEGNKLQHLVIWWQRLYDANPQEQANMLKGLNKNRARQRRHHSITKKRIASETK